MPLSQGMGLHYVMGTLDDPSTRPFSTYKIATTAVTHENYLCTNTLRNFCVVKLP
jgi:hypothetical protein